MTVRLVEKYRPAVINNESGEVTWLTPSRKYEDKRKAVDHMETAIDLAHHPPDEWEDFYQCPKSMFKALQDLEYSRNRSQLTVVLMTVYDEEWR